MLKAFEVASLKLSTWPIISKLLMQCNADNRLKHCQHTLQPAADKTDDEEQYLGDTMLTAYWAAVNDFS